MEARYQPPGLSTRSRWPARSRIADIQACCKPSLADTAGVGDIVCGYSTMWEMRLLGVGHVLALFRTLTLHYTPFWILTQHVSSGLCATLHDTAQHLQTCDYTCLASSCTLAMRVLVRPLSSPVVFSLKAPRF